MTAADRVDQLTPERAICSCINAFPEVGHPVASVSTLRFFRADYMQRCVDRARQIAQSPDARTTVAMGQTYLDVLRGVQATITDTNDTITTTEGDTMAAKKKTAAASKIKGPGAAGVTDTTPELAGAQAAADLVSRTAAELAVPTAAAPLGKVRLTAAMSKIVDPQPQRLRHVDGEVWVGTVGALAGAAAAYTSAAPTLGFGVRQAANGAAIRLQAAAKHATDKAAKKVPGKPAAAPKPQGAATRGGQGQAPGGPVVGARKRTVVPAAQSNPVGVVAVTLSVQVYRMILTELTQGIYYAVSTLEDLATAWHLPPSTHKQCQKIRDAVGGLHLP